AEYGGVVPEIASRDHLKNIEPVIEEALSRAQHSLQTIDAIAVTNRPGLSGALLIGSQVARTLSWISQKPLIAVDHLVGHLLAVFLDFSAVLSSKPPESAEQAPNPIRESQAPSYPFVGLLASGGHTGIYRVNGPLAEQISELGGTRDDAAGEAYDKVAKLLGLGYPGGPIIDQLAQEGDPLQIPLARPMAQKSLLEFSFSGLKTNVARWVKENGIPKNDDQLRNLAAAFQARVVDTLIDKSIRAARQEGIREIVLAGGVAANEELRERGAELCKKHGMRLIAPSRRACTDNAAMIAHAGLYRAQTGVNDAPNLTIHPRTALPRATRKGPGPRQSRE
ncbi:MAG: tRNA (adenosine(37)-N6)-threonylcarbamoyltransferase complex transferase subunit TsaD, partial [Polyangiaceae bacterium]|nr:tRNA (adenosine(37)-N6)-threonylcarbamoyltransferase complex transferase subunit TsaD [Polyangiaceae bacterium]